MKMPFFLNPVAASRQSAAISLFGHNKCGALPRRRYGLLSAFSMIEVAIALAVIAFALVAILQTLPLGMEIQRDNRQDTIVNHDGAYLIEAIRHGAQGIDDLANYVDNKGTGSNIIQYLSTVGAPNTFFMRSISGSAATKGPASKDLAMRYEVTSQVLPVLTLTNIDMTVPYAAELTKNLYEIRVRLRWPVAGGPGNEKLSDRPKYQVFRTVVSGIVSNGFLVTDSYR